MELARRVSCEPPSDACVPKPELEGLHAGLFIPLLSLEPVAVGALQVPVRHRHPEGVIVRPCHHHRGAVGGPAHHRPNVAQVVGELVVVAVATPVDGASAGHRAHAQPARPVERKLTQYRGTAPPAAHAAPVDGQGGARHVAHVVRGGDVPVGRVVDRLFRTLPAVVVGDVHHRYGLGGERYVVQVERFLPARGHLLQLQPDPVPRRGKGEALVPLVELAARGGGAADVGQRRVVAGRGDGRRDGPDPAHVVDVEGIAHGQLRAAPLVGHHVKVQGVRHPGNDIVLPFGDAVVPNLQLEAPSVRIVKRRAGGAPAKGYVLPAIVDRDVARGPGRKAPVAQLGAGAAPEVLRIELLRTRAPVPEGVDAGDQSRGAILIYHLPLHVGNQLAHPVVNVVRQAPIVLVPKVVVAVRVAVVAGIPYVLELVFLHAAAIAILELVHRVGAPTGIPLAHKALEVPVRIVLDARHPVVAVGVGGEVHPVASPLGRDTARAEGRPREPVVLVVPVHIGLEGPAPGGKASGIEAHPLDVPVVLVRTVGVLLLHRRRGPRTGVVPVVVVDGEAEHVGRHAAPGRPVPTRVVRGQ